MESTLVILNPAAGRGSAGARRGEIEAALRGADLPFTLQTTHARGGATELAWHGIEQGARTIVAVGGDGTINEVVNGIRGAEEAGRTRATLGIIPLGTGSDFVKALVGMQPNDIVGAVALLASGASLATDLGKVTIPDREKRYFINALGMGLDAQIAAEALKIKRLKGFAVYVLAIARGIISYKAHPMTIEYDGKRVQRRMLFATVANGRCQAGGFYLTPDGIIDDGLLDLCLVDNMRVDEIARHISKVTKGTHGALRQVTLARSRRVRISCAAPIPVQADGEILATDARELHVEIVRGGIDVCRRRPE